MRGGHRTNLGRAMYQMYQRNGRWQRGRPHSSRCRPPPSAAVKHQGSGSRPAQLRQKACPPRTVGWRRASWSYSACRLQARHRRPDAARAWVPRYPAPSPWKQASDGRGWATAGTPSLRQSAASGCPTGGSRSHTGSDNCEMMGWARAMACSRLQRISRRNSHSSRQRRRPRGGSTVAPHGWNAAKQRPGTANLSHSCNRRHKHHPNS